MRRARGWVRPIFGPRAMHLIHLLRLGVVRLHRLIADRPGGRDPVVMLKVAEILSAQPIKGRTIHLGGAPHEIVDTGLKGLAVLVLPDVSGDVAILDNHLFGTPILGLSRQPVAAFEQQDVLSQGSQMIGQRPAAGAAADDDDVIVSVAHESSLSVSKRNASLLWNSEIEQIAN